MTMFMKPFEKIPSISDLSNVPSLIGYAGRFLAVNALESAIEMCDPDIGVDTMISGGVPNSTYTIGQLYDGGTPNTDYTRKYQMNCGGP